MSILLSAALLLGAAATLAVLRIFRPRFRFSWILGVTATMAALLSVILWAAQLPLSMAIPLWQSASSSNSFATFAASSLSWPYALSIVTLTLSVLLTAPGRSDFPSPWSWASCLALGGLGLLAVTAGSPLTLVLFWAGLDLVEAALVLARAQDRSSGGQVSFAFTVRLISVALVLLAFVLGDTGQQVTGFGEIGGNAVSLLAGAALLRLAAFAIPWPGDSPALRIDETGTALHLVGGTAAVAFLSQVGPEAMRQASALILPCALAAFYSGWMWLRSPDRSLGRPMWVMCTGSLAVAAALRGSPMGATGWGSAMLLAGAPLFLTTIHEKWMKRLLLLALWIGSGLPFALTATTWLAGGGASDWMLPVLLVTQAMLLAGFLHQALKPEIEPLPRMGVTSLTGIYRAGILLPLATGIILGIWGWAGAFQVGAPLAAILVVPLVAGLAWSKRRFAALNPAPSRWLPPAWISAGSSIRREIGRLEGSAQRAAEAFTRTIEGEAGIMWSLLILVLFVSLLAGRNR